MISLAEIDGDGWVLLIMSLDVKLLLLWELTSVDGGWYAGIALAEHRQGGFVDVIVDESDGAFSLFDEVDNLHVGVEDLSIEEDAFYWGQGWADEEIYFVFSSGQTLFYSFEASINRITIQQIFF